MTGSGHRTPPRFAGSHGSIVVPHGPSAVGDLQGQIRDGFLQAASQRLGAFGSSNWMASAIKMAIEIVSFPIKSGDFPWFNMV